jgi:hydrogenase small subunit
MKISRRDFLKFLGASAATLGLSGTDLGRLQKVLANPAGPSVIWLQGAGCTGCSESFLNRISASTSEPKTAADVLINSVNLMYHPNLMALAGEDAVDQAEAAYNKGGYVLAVEGGIPTAFGGNTCWAWSVSRTDGTFQDVTFQKAVQDLAGKAAAILCIGTCASWGGIPAAPPNPTGIKGVKAATGKNTINIAGCPPHPDWIVWAVVQILLGQPIALDAHGRPTYLFGRTVHDRCPREDRDEARTFGVDNRCLEELGCRGPRTRGNCPTQLWNNQTNWCVDANALCIGCTDPQFPFTQLASPGD